MTADGRMCRMAGRRVADILIALVADGPPHAWPALLVESCRTETAMTGVGLALIDEAGPGQLVAATGGLARRLEDLQFAVGDGPCVEASRSGRPVLCPDVRLDGAARWPAFAPDAAGAGLAAAFTFPLQVGAIALGVLDLYRDTPGPISGSGLKAALAHADAAVAVLLHLQQRANTAEAGGTLSTGEPVHDGPDGVHDLEAGLLDLTERRAVVHQAAGMISVQLGVDMTVALLRLRAHAWAHERSIVDVATDVVARRLLFDHSEDGTSDGPESSDADGSPGRGPQ